MILRSTKKASLELSIRAIVIVILAMTLLGLGFGFIRSMFENITDISEGVTQQIQQQIRDELISGEKRLSFPRDEITLKKGESTILAIGIKNKQDEDLFYKINFNARRNPDGLPFQADRWFQYAPKPVDNAERIAPSDFVIKTIRLSIPREVDSGAYFLQLEVWDDRFFGPERIYAAKDFFIVVIG